MQRANPRTIGVCWLKKHKITTLSGLYFMDISYTIMDDTYIQYIYIYLSLSLSLYIYNQVNWVKLVQIITGGAFLYRPHLRPLVRCAG